MKLTARFLPRGNTSAETMLRRSSRHSTFDSQYPRRSRDAHPAIVQFCTPCAIEWHRRTVRVPDCSQSIAPSASVNANQGRGFVQFVGVVLSCRFSVPSLQTSPPVILFLGESIRPSIFMGELGTLKPVHPVNKQRSIVGQ